MKVPLKLKGSVILLASLLLFSIGSYALTSPVPSAVLPSSQITSSSIPGTSIANGAIGNSQIATGSLTGDRFSSTTTFNGGQITQATIGLDRMASGVCGAP